MGEIEDKFNILYKTKLKIMRMPNTKEKAMLVDGYIALLQYYSETLDEKNPKFNSIIEKLCLDDVFVGKYDKLLIQDTAKTLNNLSDNALILYRKYRKLLETFKEENFCSHAYNSIGKVNHEKMMNLLFDFFASLGEDVLKLYLDMLESGNIIGCFLDGYMGYATDPNPIDNPCLAIQNIPRYFDFYLTIAHEMGHAYQYYIQRNQKNFSSFNPYAEITSHLFEGLFADYLKKVHEDKYCLDYEEQEYNYLLNEISVSKIICRLLTNNNIKAIDPMSLRYECFVPPEVLEDEMTDDCGYIFSNKKDIGIQEFHYSIGKTIALYFREKLNNNFEEEWKNYKNFLCTINYLPMEEVLDKYFDVDVVANSFKKMIKSYRER